MVNFLNDGSLIGFWPLNEPSGASMFLNYSPARYRRPSGISFDFQVAQAEAQNSQQSKSPWPGTTSIFNPESGVTYNGYMVQGYWKLGADSSPFSKYLILGDGCSQVREQTLAPNVANSGFTVGMWAYPNSNGYIDFRGDALPATYNLETECARAHSLLSQKQFASLGGWHMGVSGALNNAAQFAGTVSNSGLHAFVSFERTNTTSPSTLRTPIESGCFTHLTFSFRYVDGTNDQVVLYKNGRVAASGTYSTGAGGASASTLANTTLVGRPLAIGGGDQGSAGTNTFSGTCGWNHLVSGVYFFRRVLNEAEVLDLHNGSTLQPLESNKLATVEVSITDPQLLAYYPFRSIGWPDASKNHRPLAGPRDEGPVGTYIPVPGPFVGGGMLQNGASASDAVVATSGLIYDMISARSWTIGILAGPVTGLGRDDNMIFSMGSISTATAGTGPTAISAATFGMALTEWSTPNRIRFSAYPLGDITASVFNIDTATSGYFIGAMHHYAVAYDDSTKGIAFYLDGTLQGSGTLAHSLTSQLSRLAGSGYPLMFTNGVTDATMHTVLAAGGSDLYVGPITIMGRALLPEEIRYIAQSGINTVPLWLTTYDPRLIGYWPCSDYKLDDVIVEDRARVWEFFPGNLTRGDTETKWEAWQLSPKFNQFGTRTTPPELASYGVLGITSGIFGVQGLSPADSALLNAAAVRSAIANLSNRYKPVNEQNNLISQNILGDFVMGFEVTPSGTIQADPLGLTANATKFEFNSTLALYGNLGAGSTGGELRAFLTTVDAGEGSGVTIVFASRTGTFSAANYVPLVSGTLPYGVPSKVLFHSKFDNPYNVTGETTGQAPLGVSLWINGVRVQRRSLTAATAKIWVNGAVDAAGDNLLLQFGGEASNNTYSTVISRDGGLGDIYMREMFLMRGIFTKGEMAALAASGIQLPIIAGYTPTLPKTQVTIADAALKGYWRFNGLDGGGSGTKDLSFNMNHLTPISEQKNRQVGGSNASSRALKFFPGPLKNSDLGVQCSGIGYAGTAIASPFSPAFAVSGQAFDSPQNGFSVGFLMAARAVVGGTTAATLLAYGIVGNNASNTAIDFNKSWAIVVDATFDIKMVMSVGGNGYYAELSTSANSGQMVCGARDAGTVANQTDANRYNSFIYGNQKPPHLNFWNHYCWTYLPTEKELVCYVNGQEVDRRSAPISIDPLNGGPASGLKPIVPVNPATRMITFLQHQNAAPWDFTSTLSHVEDQQITDVFYFNRALTQNEVRYISQNGIDSATGTSTSGTLGGFITGANQSSGIIGGYNRGQDTASGIIGGWNFGAFQASGMIGGYVSGISFFAAAPSGYLGGYIHGMDIPSGIIGGYINGAGPASGIIGGFILGGLLAQMQFDGGFVVQAVTAKDFDAQITLRKNTTSDFDAKLVIFQAEIGPDVDILVPDGTLNVASAPFNQYLVGLASGTQGKTIVQTRWTFGDLSSAVSVAESGAGLYPTQHHYAASGFYIAKFEAIDSNGIHGSATRIINAASGIDPVIVSLSGVPRSGTAALTVDFATAIDILPPGVSLTAKLLNFDDGQSSITLNPTHVYTEPGVYKPILIVRDSRGVIWCDSMEAGNDLLKGL